MGKRLMEGSECVVEHRFLSLHVSMYMCVCMFVCVEER